jgi:hypothetical protein
MSVRCTAFDYGAYTPRSDTGAFAGLTPLLPPFPPPAPSCNSFTKPATCPDRCFWVAGTGCANTPPIACGNNTPGGGGNDALCVHVYVNTTERNNWTYLADAGSFNETIISPPPKSFSQDMWYSVWDGEIQKPPSLHSFRYCVQYITAKDLQFAVCVSLDGAFDLQVATTETLKYNAKWQSNTPFVAEVVIQDNITSNTQ